MNHEPSPAPYHFRGEVSNPGSPRFAKGLVLFYVSSTEGRAFNAEKSAELLDQDDHSYPVTIRSVGSITPDLSSPNNKWQPGDFMISVEGITMDQAVHMRHIRQV